MALDWKLEALGSVAAVCTTSSFLPGLIRVWRRKSAKDISLVMFTVMNTGLALWLVYGFLVHEWPIIAANSLTLAQGLAILVLKLIYDRRDRRNVGKLAP
jgi:MtN3 and saliva related transmembrane protein